MVYGDVEERHVTEYDIPEDSKPFVSIVALFNQRLKADFEDCVKFTDLARREASGADIFVVETGLDNEGLKRIPEFPEGTKLSDLFELFHKKIKRAFGRGVLDERRLQAAEESRSPCGRWFQSLLFIWLPRLVRCTRHANGHDKPRVHRRRDGCEKLRMEISCWILFTALSRRYCFLFGKLRQFRWLR